MRFLLPIIVVFCSETLNAQQYNIEKSDFYYQISPVYNFKKCIVSLTFDDGYLNQFKVAMPLLKKRDLAATFYVITNNMDSTSLELIYAKNSPNFEIASHTTDHANLVKMGNLDVYNELYNSKLVLKKYFGNNSGLTMSYPGGYYNNSVMQIAKENYLAARTSDIGYNSYHYPERYALKAQSFNKHTSAEITNKWVDYAKQNHLWLIETIHGIGNNGFSPIDSNNLIENLDYIKKNEEDVLCSTIVNVIKYIDESKNTELKCEFCNDTLYKIKIKDLLDNPIYDQPLSIKIKIPTNWDSISLEGVSDFKTEYVGKNKFVLLNILPGTRELTIRPGLISNPDKESGFRIVYLSANPFLDDIRLSLEVFNNQDIEFVLSNMNGKLLVQKIVKNVTGIINFSFETNDLGSGIYILKVISKKDGYFVSKKMIKAGM
jgi:peptidoglycan/xylan/chitin deacetylase (PgdA/CDA1 family)